MMKNKDYFNESIKKHLNSGYSYSNAYFKTFNSLVSDNLKPEFASNNLLALEYIKALREINSNIKPVAVKRTNSYNAERFSTKHLFQSALSTAASSVLPSPLKSPATTSQPSTFSPLPSQLPRPVSYIGDASTP